MLTQVLQELKKVSGQNQEMLSMVRSLHYSWGGGPRCYLEGHSQRRRQGTSRERGGSQDREMSRSREARLSREMVENDSEWRRERKYSSARDGAQRERVQILEKPKTLNWQKRKSEERVLHQDCIRSKVRANNVTVNIQVLTDQIVCLKYESC